MTQRNSSALQNTVGMVVQVNGVVLVLVKYS